MTSEQITFWFAVSLVVPLWILGGYAALLFFDPQRRRRRRRR